MPLKERGFFADFYVSSISFGYWTGRKLSSSSFERALSSSCVQMNACVLGLLHSTEH